MSDGVVAAMRHEMGRGLFRIQMPPYRAFLRESEERTANPFF